MPRPIAGSSRDRLILRGGRAGAGRSGGDVNVAASRIGSELVTRGAIAAGAVIVLVSVTTIWRRGPSNFVKLQRVGSG